MHLTRSILICCILPAALIGTVYGQVELLFTAKLQNQFFPLDSIRVENLATGRQFTKLYPDTLLNLVITGRDDMFKPGAQRFSIQPNYPNPFENETRLDIYLPQKESLEIYVYDVSGRLVSDHHLFLPEGGHTFTFNSGREGIYFLSARTSSYSETIKMVCLGATHKGNTGFKYFGINNFGMHTDRPGKTKSQVSEPEEYHPGDSLRFIGFVTKDTHNILADTITDLPDKSKIYRFQFENPNRIIILMYHKLVDSVPGNDYERSVADFENDLLYLINHPYQILSLDDLSRVQTGELELMSDAVILTFDDGYHSDSSKAVPLLLKYNIPATFFVVAEWIGDTSYMTWPDVWNISQYRDSVGNNPFHIGSHTSSHSYLEESIQYFPDHGDWLDFLNTELGDSKNWIVDVTGQTSIFLSLPFGDGAYNGDIIQTAIQNGYSGIRTSKKKSINPGQINIYSLPAIAILSETTISNIESFLEEEK